MTTEPANIPAPRVRPAVRWTAIVALMLLLPFAAHAAWDYVETRRLVRELDDIRAKKEGLTPADVGRGYRALNDEETRAARYYMAAAILAYQPASSDGGALTALRAIVAGASPVLDLSGIRSRLEAVTHSGSEALALLDAGARLPFKGFPPGTEYNYRTSEIWMLRHLNAMRTAALALAGNGDGAAAAVLADLQLRTMYGVTFWYAPNEIAALLSFSRPSEATLLRLDAALAAAEQPERATAEMIADRATMIDQAWREYYGPDPRVPGARTLPRRTLDGWLARPWVTHSLVGVLRAWREAIEASRTPWPAKLPAIADVQARYPLQAQVRQAGSGARILVAAFPVASAASSLVRSAANVLVGERGARIALAIERHRRDHNDALPARLEDLVPRYLETLPDDPFSGKPLLYKPAADAYTVYSVGEDGQDDGGDLVSEFIRDKERGWGRKPLRGKDTGIRVLLAQGAGGRAQGAGEGP